MSGRAGLVVITAGPLLLVQDAGRPGRLAQGVSPSGFADAASAARANRLVGNPADTAVLESLFGGVELEAVGATAIVAVSGVVGAVEVVVDGDVTVHSAEMPIGVPVGGRVRIAPPTAGLRPMIAVRGGIAVAPVLGSRSRDTIAGIGPEPLAAGDLLAVGAAAHEWPVVDFAVVLPPPPPGSTLVLEFAWGPREDRLTGAGRAVMLLPRAVSSRGDRVGVRLDGPVIEAADDRLASEPTVAGAIELPTDGIPFVLGRDHPVTVGYPVVGVVTAVSLDRLAQARPGTPVRLAPVG